ncbi:hypothetical protein E0L36_23220 [Streptomyces sp. AJS327]|nr:hypothetical protein [Streptomyces sp. AJS327]
MTLWRLPSAGKSLPQRYLWISFLALALSLTCEIPHVERGIDAWFHITGLANLFACVSCLIAAAAMISFVEAITPPNRAALGTRKAAVYIVVALQVTFFVLAQQRHSLDSFSDEGETVVSIGYKAVFALYVGVATLLGTVLFYSGTLYSRGWAKAGLYVLSGGTALGLVYALHRIVALAFLYSDQPTPGGAELTNTLSLLLKSAAVLCIAVGSCLPPMAIAIRTVRDWRSLHQLAPLWRAVTQAVPQVVLPAAIPRRRVRHRLQRRVVEIQDACLALREYVPAAVQDRALSSAQSANSPDPRATAEAGWLATGMLMAASHDPTPGDHPTPGLANQSRDTEMAWLRRVNHAYRTSPFVPAFARAQAAALTDNAGGLSTASDTSATDSAR